MDELGQAEELGEASLKTASFTVHGTTEQSRRWKIAAEQEGHSSAGSWLAYAADRYLELQKRAGRPLPLSWRRGTFRVLLEAGETTVKGHVSEPFYAFRGSFKGLAPTGHVYSLVHRGQIAATLATYSQVRALAAELAPVLIRGDPAPDPGGIIDRHRREAV